MTARLQTRLQQLSLPESPPPYEEPAPSANSSSAVARSRRLKTFEVELYAAAKLVPPSVSELKHYHDIDDAYHVAVPSSNDAPPFIPVRYMTWFWLVIVLIAALIHHFAYMERYEFPHY